MEIITILVAISAVNKHTIYIDANILKEPIAYQKRPLAIILEPDLYHSTSIWTLWQFTFNYVKTLLKLNIYQGFT